jgi:hypothetical protein
MGAARKAANKKFWHEVQEKKKKVRGKRQGEATTENNKKLLALKKGNVLGRIELKFKQPKKNGHCQRLAINNAVEGRILSPKACAAAVRYFGPYQQWCWNGLRLYDGGAKGYWSERVMVWAAGRAGYRMVRCRVERGHGCLECVHGRMEEFRSLMSGSFAAGKRLLFLTSYYELMKIKKEVVDQQIKHAVAFRDNVVVDSNYPFGIPLSEYPYVSMIDRVYEIVPCGGNK